MSILKKRLSKIYYDLGIIAATPCSDEENERYSKMKINGDELPSNIFSTDGANFFRYDSTEEIQSERVKEIILYKQARHLETISKCATFFVVITSIGLACCLLYLLNIILY